MDSAGPHGASARSGAPSAWSGTRPRGWGRAGGPGRAPTPAPKRYSPFWNSAFPFGWPLGLGFARFGIEPPGSAMHFFRFIPGFKRDKNCLETEILLFRYRAISVSERKIFLFGNRNFTVSVQNNFCFRTENISVFPQKKLFCSTVSEHVPNKELNHLCFFWSRICV